MRRIGLLAVLAVVVLSQVPAQRARAVGGDDLSPATKVAGISQACQATVASKGAAYASKAAAAMNACLDAVLKCDEQKDAATALKCRRSLLVMGTGKCAVGKVDEGASMIGSGAALHAETLLLSKAVLLKEMRKYTAAIQKKCFDVPLVDLGSVSTGLGFSPTPGDKLAVADATNPDPGGLQCLANDIVLQTHPLANDITQIVENLHGTCVVSKDLSELGTACTSNTDCDGAVPTYGRCGQLAKVFRGGNIKECSDFPATGQTLCANTAGTAIACAGTGHDGDSKAGAPLTYKDNGDGTITDSNTGLMWEKLSDDGTVHDKDNAYTWDNTFAVKIAALNAGGGFAGHTDWRVPNRRELESIVNLQSGNPSVSPEFNNGCVASCTVTTCSCTVGISHWSSSTNYNFSSNAWIVDFIDGVVNQTPKTSPIQMRAVRSAFREGSALPPVVAVCGNGTAEAPEECDDGDLVNGNGCSATCTIEVPGPIAASVATGQTTCWNTAGTVIACAGTGQDGELQFGATLAYVDNGDGTITDSNTGLMWEKLSDDGTVHDKDNLYTWDNAFAVKVATLNGGGGFAGHTDWRVPNIKELQSIINYAIPSPGPTVAAAFNTGCVATCTVNTCSCTLGVGHWSSSSFANGPFLAWALNFDAGNVNANIKTDTVRVRAVRGGL